MKTNETFEFKLFPLFRKYLKFFIIPVVLILYNLSLNAQFETSRTSGAAPLYVFFDASATTDTSVTQPFHELFYSWNFGDTASGTWTYSNKSRNSATGAISAHVYEEPGTYTVELTIKNPNGDLVNQSVIIDVLDPDVVFSGENTICFSQTGDFTQSPVGALNITTSSYSEVMGYISIGKRLLLRRGETWDAHLVTVDAHGPGIIGSFGPGTDPILTGGFFKLASGIKSDPNEVNTDDWRIMDLQFTAGGYAIDSDGEMRDILLLRLNITDYTYPSVMFTGAILVYYNENHGQNHEPHNRVALVDCNISQVNGWTVFGDIRRFALMGCYLGPSLGSHVIRFEFLNKAVICNNYMTSAAAQRHLIKLYGPVWAGNALFPPETYTEKVIFSDNYFNGGNEDWLVTIGPENRTSDERVRDVIFERNYFNSSNINQVLLLLWSSYVTVRNNIFNLSEALFHTAVSIKQRGVEPPPENVSVYNNTAYSSDAGDFVFTLISPEVSNTTVINNLASAPNSSSPQMISGSGSGLTESNNLLTDNPGFIVPDPVNPEDFNLQIGSSAIDAGIEVTVFNDYTDNLRPFNGFWDLGAYEYNDGSTVVHKNSRISDNCILRQNYPNPFNSSTTIEYSVTKPCNVQLKIYDLFGREVCVLVSKQMSAGEYSVRWNGLNRQGNKLASGIYYYQLQTFTSLGEAIQFSKKRKMILLH